jgi:UDPglucose 6-dehydrogenase
VRIGVIGLGVVGRAQVRTAVMAGLGDHEIVTYDPKYDAVYPDGDLRSCDLALICVPTPSDPEFHGRQDQRSVVTAYKRLPPEVPAVIRSTVLPGTTEWLARTWPRSGPVVHVPEFMQEREGGPWPESFLVPFVLLGGEPEARAAVRPLLGDLFPHPLHECRAVEAELAKYVSNLYWATRVTFVNEAVSICWRAGADWEAVRAAWQQDQRVDPAYTAVEGFKPGFGGACWPKDLRALISYCRDHGYVPGFLEAVEQANERFISD